MDVNLTRLFAIMNLFRLKSVDLTATGYSEGYISKLLAGKIRGADEFYLRLNARLIEMITLNGGGTSVFNIPPTNTEKVEQLLKVG